MTVLAGVELNIENDGTVDFDQAALEGFDLVTASIHKGFNQSREEITARTVAAIENPGVDVIGHPTGRILGKRPPFDIDLEAVFEAATRTGTALELNSFPNRLDLRDDYLREGKERGVIFSVSTDAHIADHLRYIDYGIVTAQRGWLEAKDVVNCQSLAELRKWLER